MRVTKISEVNAIAVQLRPFLKDLARDLPPVYNVHDGRPGLDVWRYTIDVPLGWEAQRLVDYLREQFRIAVMDFEEGLPKNTKAILSLGDVPHIVVDDGLPVTLQPLPEFDDPQLRLRAFFLPAVSTEPKEE